MLIKQEKGLTGIDVAISIVVLTIFISMIGSLIVNINLDSRDTERKTVAVSYAVQEIEKKKAEGYVDSYNDKGITGEEILEEVDILDKEGNFSGYHKKTTIKDYVFIKNDDTKQKNLVKEITVEILYRLGNKDKSVKISTYITSNI